MFNGGNAIEGRYAGEVSAKSEYELPLVERLKRQLAQQATQKQKIERVLEILEKNPEIQELLNLAREVGF